MASGTGEVFCCRPIDDQAGCGSVFRWAPGWLVAIRCGMIKGRILSRRGCRSWVTPKNPQFIVGSPLRLDIGSIFICFSIMFAINAGAYQLKSKLFAG